MECVLVLDQTAGWESDCELCLMQPGVCRGGKAVLGPGCCGLLSLRCKEEQGKALTEYFPPFWV